MEGKEVARVLGARVNGSGGRACEADGQGDTAGETHGWLRIGVDARSYDQAEVG